MTGFDFLIACTYPNVSRCPTNSIREFVAGSEDLRHLTLLANYHGVAPLFYHNLKQVCWDLLTPKLREYIEQYFQVASRHNLFQSRELGRLVQLFKDGGISSIALKGQSLAHLAYGDTSLRKSMDLDLLIPSEKLSDAEQILLDDGYEPYDKVKNLGSVRKRIYLWLSKQYPFKRHAGVFLLDLHTAVMPPGYRYPVKFDTFRSRSRQIDIGGVDIAVFEPVDIVMLLAYHGIKNRWESLKYVCDIAALVENLSEDDWETLLERAHKNRCKRILMVGLLLAHQIYKSPLPQRVEINIEADNKVKEVTTNVLDVMSNRHTGRQFSYSERVRFHLAVRESVVDKMRYIVYSLMLNTWSTLLRQSSIENE